MLHFLSVPGSQQMQCQAVTVIGNSFRPGSRIVQSHRLEQVLQAGNHAFVTGGDHLGTVQGKSEPCPGQLGVFTGKRKDIAWKAAPGMIRLMGAGARM